MTAAGVVLAFVCMFTLDFVWARYNIACAARSPLIAAIYAALIAVFSATNILLYVADHWLIIPTMAGAFAGTYVAVTGKS